MFQCSVERSFACLHEMPILDSLHYVYDDDDDDDDDDDADNNLFRYYLR